MPGRPRRKLRDLKELEGQAHDLGMNILRATPRQYIRPPDREDPIWHTWRAARQSAALSAHHLGRLRYRLEQRGRDLGGRSWRRGGATRRARPFASRCSRRRGIGSGPTRRRFPPSPPGVRGSHGDTSLPGESRFLLTATARWNSRSLGPDGRCVGQLVFGALTVAPICRCNRATRLRHGHCPHRLSRNSRSVTPTF